MSDLFADLLKESFSGTSSPSKNSSNLSLNEQLKTKSTTLSNGSGSLDMDFLDKYLDSKQKVSKPTSSLNKSTKASDYDDFFSGISTPKPAQVQSNESQSLSQIPSNSTNLLDDFFGQPITASKPLTASTQLELQHQEITTTKIESIPSDQELRDSALAELLDMGFPLEKANNALDSTANGHDLDSAITFLMNQAHSSGESSNQRSTMISQTRSDYNNDNVTGDFGKIVNDLSTDFMSTASFLFNSGKKKLQQGVEMYRQQKLDNNNGQPLWMKNQERYKANSIKLPHQEGDQDEEIDPEEMKRLIMGQRLREQKLKQQKALNVDLLSNDNNKNDTPSFSRDSTPVNDNMRSSPKLPSSHDDIYVSSSRRRRPQAVSPAQSLASIPISTLKSTPKPQVFETLIETTPVTKPLLEIPTLNPAQLMMFTNSRNTAQENFKNGDYPKSLDNYMIASQNIPSDHPFQILLYSNIALIYSKLGNPKDQLVYADKGLELIKSSTNNETISNLSSVLIENNKNARSLWIKLMTKRAESLEMLEKWKLSKESYELLISNGENSKPIMDGKNRCMKILNPTISRPKTKAKPSPQPVNLVNNEKLKRVKENSERQKNEDQEKFALHDKVAIKLENWRTGNTDNIRGLICNLDKILWPELNWKNVTLTDLVMDKKVKIYYMKAVSKTHPDKISSLESTEHKMIANGVFITLNEAWELFKKDKGL